MKRIEDPRGDAHGYVTYQLTSGRCIRVDRYLIQEYGIRTLLKMYGEPTDGDPVPVYQGGRQIGAVPFDFDPLAIKSTTFLYEPRPGDFVRNGDRWDANRMLCPGDFEAIPGFVWKREPTPTKAEGKHHDSKHY